MGGSAGGTSDSWASAPVVISWGVEVSPALSPHWAPCSAGTLLDYSLPLPPFVLIPVRVRARVRVHAHAKS